MTRGIFLQNNLDGTRNKQALVLRPMSVLWDLAGGDSGVGSWPSSRTMPKTEETDVGSISYTFSDTFNSGSPVSSSFFLVIRNFLTVPYLALFSRSHLFFLYTYI